MEVLWLGKIKVAVAGVGNCCSALVQGVQHYSTPKDERGVGILNVEIGGYRVMDIDFVAAFDVDARKVGQDLSKAIFAEPNNTIKFSDVGELGVPVQKAEILDGVGEYVKDRIIVAPAGPVDVSEVLKKIGAEILINFLPTGAVDASRYYAAEAIDASCGYVNATPAKIASVKAWQRRFREAKVALAGDDVMDQIGSTIIHKAVLKTLVERGILIDESYQLDIGGGTESLNALERARAEIKRATKKASVGSVVPYTFPLVAGSSDYVDFMENARTSYFWISGRYFGSAPFAMDIRLNTVEGPACAGIMIDVIRAMKVAIDRGISGPLLSVSAFAFKMPPKMAPPEIAQRWFYEFVSGKRDK
jgi:myo-inositol-1-phosphate synthase